jgi:hypothetical protein
VEDDIYFQGEVLVVLVLVEGTLAFLPPNIDTK